MRRFFFVPLFLLFLISNPFLVSSAVAEDSDRKAAPADLVGDTFKTAGGIVSSVFDLGNIIVGGKRLASPFHEFVSSSVSSSNVVTRGDIEVSGARNVPEALAEVPGVVLSDLSGNGEEPTLDFRGFNEGEDFVFTLDGVRLNEPKSNTINFPLIPLSLIERMEVSRGGASFLYGEGAMGGVANLVSGLPEGPGWHGRVRSLAGSFGEWGESFETDAKTGGYGAYVTGDIYHTEGFRQNSSVEKQDVYTKLIWDLSEKARLAASYLHARARLDRSGSIRESLLRNQGPEATERPRNFGNLGTDMGILNFSAEPAESVVANADLFVRRSTELSVANFATFDTNDNELNLTMDSWGGTVQIDQSHGLFWGLREDVLVGVDYTRNQIDEQDYSRSKSTLGRIAETVDSNAHKDAFGIFSKASFSWNDFAGAYFGLRYDDIQFRNTDLINTDNNTPSDVSKFSHSAGISCDLADTVALSAIYSHSFRAPTLSDLYANPLFGGNPALKPEESSDYELGVKWHPKTFTAKSAVFLNNRVNEIGFDPTLIDGTHLFGRNNNFGKTRREGIESSVETRPFSWMRARASHTYTEARFESNTPDGLEISGDHIPMIPRNRFTGDIFVEPAKDLSLDLNMVSVAKQVLTNDLTNDRNGRRLPSYTVFNFKTLYEYKGWQISFEVKNLFDERYEIGGSLGAAPSVFNADHTVEDNFFVPAPGRSYAATLAYCW